MKKMMSEKGQDVGAAKGSAAPGSDNTAAGSDAKDKQFKGSKGGPTKPQESASTGTNSMAGRGMTSDIAAKHWSGNIPKSQKEDRLSKK